MPSFLPRVVVLAGAVFTSACMPASIEEGEVLDVPFSPASAIVAPPQEGGEDTLVVYISDDGELCSRLQSGGPGVIESTLMLLSFAKVDDEGENVALEAGSYEIISLSSPPTGAGNYGTGFFAHRTTCEEGESATATGGTMELSSYTKGGAASGTFSLDLKTLDAETTDEVNGSFSASYCDYDIEQDLADPCEDEAS